MLSTRLYPNEGRLRSSLTRLLAIYKGRKLSTVAGDSWEIQFTRAIQSTVDFQRDINEVSYLESSERLRSLLRSGLLRHTDLVTHPERFFLAHRILAKHATKIGPGFWVRFTVHYNLCMGSILGLGSDEQVSLLDEFQDKGLLGCFSLTEKFAGVNSGMVVNTIAEYMPNRDSFVIRTPNEGAKKNWISQGLCADKSVVVADLRMGNKSFGPHAFLIDLRKDGNLTPGVTVGDMGRKTVGNDLDNAWIAFDAVEVPKSSLLNRFADIESGQYVQKVKGMPVFHMIGQRLFTGRVAVAQAAHEFRQSLFKTTRRYTDDKRVWSPSGEEVVLSDIPQVKALFEEESEKGRELAAFLAKCEAELSSTLKSNQLPSIELVQAIAAAKVRASEESILLCHRLRNEVGSFALMHGNGFEQTDFLQVLHY